MGFSLFIIACCIFYLNKKKKGWKKALEVSSEEPGPLMQGLTQQLGLVE